MKFQNLASLREYAFAVDLKEYEPTFGVGSFINGEIHTPEQRFYYKLLDGWPQIEEIWTRTYDCWQRQEDSTLLTQAAREAFEKDISVEMAGNHDDDAYELYVQGGR